MIEELLITSKFNDSKKFEPLNHLLYDDMINLM